MPVKYVKRNECDAMAVNDIASYGDIPMPLAKLLAGRGVSTHEEAIKFLNPSAEDMCDPFEIYGMRAAVDKIQKAVSEDAHILIYGDYDCDGLTAISILYSYFLGRVSKVDYYVPKRHGEGYGLHTIVLQDLAENIQPDLIITVDCGITSKAEVEYIKSKGVDVIVTDHHEPIDGLIPDCVILNAKMDKSVFHDYCGAGVALKLVEALSGRDEALKYVGYAAIGTIADIVPLLGENRIIAKLGLDKINKLDSIAGRAMAAKMNKDFANSNDIMFKIAPRINALGRLKDATPIVDFFTSSDEARVTAIVDELEEINRERQEQCEDIVNSILEKLKGYDLTKYRIIVLEDRDWNIGILGIAASKLSNMFYRPVVLLTEGEDGLLRGSARSNDKINIFECLNACANRFVAFGGHQSAAGVTISRENVDIFREEINAYILEHYDEINFYPDVVYDLRFNREVDYNCVAMLEKLEPCGFCNQTPVFYLEKAGIKFSQIGATPHIKGYYGNVELVAFNYIEHIEAMNCETNLVFTLQNKEYKQKKYTQGIVKTHTMVTPRNISEEYVSLRYIMYSVTLPYKTLVRPIKRCKIEDIDVNNGIFGNLYIAFSTKTYYDFIKTTREKGGYLIADIGTCVNKNPYNRIVLVPNSDSDFRYYKNIYLLDEPVTYNYISMLQSETNAEVYLVGEGKVNIDTIQKSRCSTDNDYREMYKLLKKNDFFGSKSFFEFYNKLFELRDEVNIFKVLTTSYILFELGLVELTEKNGFRFVKGIKSTLNKSIIYNYIKDFC